MINTVTPNTEDDNRIVRAAFEHGVRGNPAEIARHLRSGKIFAQQCAGVLGSTNSNSASLKRFCRETPIIISGGTQPRDDHFTRVVAVLPKILAQQAGAAGPLPRA